MVLGVGLSVGFLGLVLLVLDLVVGLLYLRLCLGFAYDCFDTGG